MKTMTQLLLRSALALAATLAVANCSNGGGGSSSAAATTFYWNGGICYQSGTLTPVANTNCASGAYSQTNGQCYAPTGAVASIASCSGTGATSGNGYYCTGTSGAICYTSGIGGTTPCYGLYYSNSNGAWYSGYCNGSNCSGYTLYNSSGQQVRCQ